MIFLLKIIALFEDFHLDGLTSVNLIVGDNNTGKTSLLEAIYLLVKQPESFHDQGTPALIEILQNRDEFIQKITSESTKLSNHNKNSHKQIYLLYIHLKNFILVQNWY